MSYPPRRHPMQLLFVDDEEMARKYFSIIFGKGWDIVLAKDGAEGLDILFSDRGKSIGVIVTDQIMPRMTGIEMLERVCLRNPHLIKVLSTAYTDSELVAGAARSGVIDYFVGKPWAIDKLHEILEQAATHYRHQAGKGLEQGGRELFGIETSRAAGH